MDSDMDESSSDDKAEMMENDNDITKCAFE